MGVVSLQPRVPGLTGGASDRVIRGTGTAHPGGIEAIYEYNGSLLNVRDWYDTFIITSIGGMGDPDVRDARDVNPGRDGETYFNAYYGGRTITITGKIRAFSLAKLRDMQQGLKQIFGDLSGELPLYIRTGDPVRDVFIYCKKSAPIVMDEAQADFQYTRDFQITLRASNPRFVSYLEERVYNSGLTVLDPGVPGAVQAWNYSSNPRAYAGQTTTSSWGAYAVPGVTGFTTTAAQASNPSYVFPTGRAFRINGNTPSSGNSGFGIQRGQQLTVVPGKTYRWQVAFVPVTHPWRDASGLEPASLVYRVGMVWTLAGGGSSGIPAAGSDFTVSHAGGIYNVTATAPSNAIAVTCVIYTQSVPGATYDFYVGDSLFVDNSLYPSGPYFDGESIMGLWLPDAKTNRYFGTSYLYATTGLEGLYTQPNGTPRLYVASDGWIRPLGGNNVGTITDRRLTRSDLTRDYSDLQVTFKYKTGAVVDFSLVGGVISHMLKNLAFGDYLSVHLAPVGAGSNIWFSVNNESSGGLGLGSVSASFTLAPNTTYWLRARIVGNVLTGEHWTTDPTLGGTPAVTNSTTLTGATATKFGAGIKGPFGIRSLLGVNSYDWAFADHKIDPLGTDLLYVFTVSNDGNANAQPTFRVYGPLSAVANGGNAARIGTTIVRQDGTSLTQNMIINAKSGSTLAIPSGNYIEINTDKRTLKEYDSSGNFVRNSYDQLDISSDWVELFPGDNPVEVQGYATSQPIVEMRYRHAYL